MPAAGTRITATAIRVETLTNEELDLAERLLLKMAVVLPVSASAQDADEMASRDGLATEPCSGLNPQLQEFTGTPLHDWSSHAGDAF